MTNLSAKSASLKTTIVPMLSVRGGAAAVEFYKEAFGATELFRMDAEDGTVVAELTVGESNFWVSDESPVHQNFSPESLGGASARMVMVVENPDAVFDQAVTAGGSVVSPVADQEYGWRVGRVIDQFGHHWEIGKPL
jgi:PhnB protein